MSQEARVRQSVDGAVQALGKQPGPLLEILHRVQADLGYVPAESVPLIADALNLSRAEVHGVISFYHHFRREPPGRCVVQVCRAEACKAMHGDELAEALRKRLRIDFGQTRADGAVSLEAVYCLGNCAIAPSVTVGGIVYGRCSAGNVDSLLETWGVPP